MSDSLPNAPSRSCAVCSISWMTRAGCKEDGEGYNGVRGCAAYCTLTARHFVSCLPCIDRQIYPVSCIVERATKGKRKIGRILEDDSTDEHESRYTTQYIALCGVCPHSSSELPKKDGRSLDPSWYARTYTVHGRHDTSGSQMTRREEAIIALRKRRKKIPTSELKAAKGRKILSKAARARRRRKKLSSSSDSRTFERRRRLRQMELLSRS